MRDDRQRPVRRSVGTVILFVAVVAEIYGVWRISGFYDQDELLFFVLAPFYTLPGILQNVSQIEGVLPSSAAAPSI